MRIFRSGLDEIVRINSREFLLWKKTIIGFSEDLKNFGFTYKKNEGYFVRDVEMNEVDSAYVVVENYAMYKGFRARVGSYKKDTGEIYIMIDNEREGESAGITPIIDYSDKCTRYYYAYVPESEISDIYEVRKPLKDFPFETPRIVFHKKDGEWIPWHDYGTPLKEDEWI